MHNNLSHFVLLEIGRGSIVGIVFACIAPHGAEIIPDLAGDMLDAFALTRKGMEELAILMKKQKPDTIVLATPHNLRLEATIGIVTSAFTEGALEENNKKIKLRCECDHDLALAILSNSKRSKLPVVGANYGTSEGPGSCMPMDWGTLIPQWFLVGQNPDKLKVVIVTPSREIPLQRLVRFGQIIAETAQTLGKRVAFVASADQGHAHKADGPYGFHDASAKYDEIVKRAISENRLQSLFDLPQEFIENAKPDSLWQLAILHGVLKRAKMNSCLLSYQVPTYYGMLCAVYLPKK
jgi:aromatic ring-opening dioxygenase LigB subunit